MNVLVELIAFAVAIGVLVVVHEYGHYRVARWCGVKVLRFSIGFGQPIARWVSKKTGTEWTLAALPLGGYVKMLDEREPGPGVKPEELGQAFNRQSVGKRIAIVAAGPIANFLLAIVLFAAVFATGVTEPAAIIAPPAAGTVAARAGFDGNETIVSIRDAQGGDAQAVRSWSDLRWKLLAAAFDHREVVLGARDGGSTYDFRVDLRQIDEGAIDDDFMARLGFETGGGTLSVASVQPGSAAQQAGLKPGDKLLAIDGERVGGASRFIDAVKHHAGKPLALKIERGGAAQTVTIVPQAQRDEETGQQVGRIGAALSMHTPGVDVRYGPIDSLKLGAHRTWDIAVYSLRMFGRMITGDASLKNLSGPVTIADYAGKSARLGPSAFLSFLALVSISLGVLNLLPIPVLDGGHLLYYLVEAATGKAVSERWQLILQRAGLICIVALSAIALFNDLARLIHF
ncbi:RIP metalloprotease RseP [Burkholderia stagnalis]|uniref:Zinc metalloprotease n=1 Tax=Burkholderia stagnalis TaxID=1503054 RepID=A0A3P0E086_9BURK|nr:RIP metalloprotease RseP [Burkholderia stagnalis]KAB0632868.1 RIP metalloprotease RseP [Burkholderia stagnalis]KVL84871.1 RIP metalloprotease RseP [Burkholderia stagnalis]KVL90486.1 RIP metalloprotease RseP [Burkholderia stagnalis]KVM06304.1 RIP metalloprotease RseP [Burkholderia stagnalis]KVM87217.1 RIP metalloprotease RseP [Burkholderia stagnalis]